MIKGTGVALITPFRENGDIDFEKLKSIVEFQISSNIDYLVIFGTTSEAPLLSVEEKNNILKVVKETNKGRVPLIVGIGGNNTYETAAKIESFDSKDITAFLVVSPYYNCPTQEGIYNHYKFISKHSPLGIIAYNVPSRTGRNMLPDTTLRLAKEKAIIGIKEASGIMNQVTNIIYGKPEGFTVLSGDDAIALPIIAVGGDGVISVISNAFPQEFSQLIRYSLAADFQKARIYHKIFHKLYKLLFTDGNPAGIKAVLNIKGFCDNYLRLPLVPVTDLTYKEIEQTIEKINIDIKNIHF